MNYKYRSIQISIHTFDYNIPLVQNAEYLEIDIKSFDHMNKKQFEKHVLETAERFWYQIQQGPIHGNTTFDFKRTLDDENIGNK